MEVTVFNASEKVVFEKSVMADATFATGTLPAGNYIVQFKSRNGALRGNQYLLVISAGKKKVIADAVAGEQFAGGGVAMKLKVEPGLHIAGQIANDASSTANSIARIRVINGKRYVWVAGYTGSNLGPHWELEGIAPANNVTVMSGEQMWKLQDRFFEGSTLDRYNTGRPGEVHVHGAGY